MAAIGESSSSPSNSTNGKPVVVRVKRKSDHSPLEAFWLEINARPSKRPLLEFEKLSISESVDEKVEELKTKKVFVQHVETCTTSEATADLLQSFVPKSDNVIEDKSKIIYQRKQIFKKDNKQEQILTKSRENQEVLAKNARFEQIWRRRRENQEELHDQALHDMCQFYDVVRVDVEERSNQAREQEVTSLDDQRLLCSYLPLLREFIPSAAKEIESDMHAYMSEQDDYVYDYYTVKDDMDIGDIEASSPFPLVRVEDEDFFDGLDDESEYDSEDSNAEAHPRNEYPDETSEEEDEVESEASLPESEEQENDGASSKSSEFEDLRNGLLEDAHQAYVGELRDYFENSYEDDICDNFDNDDDSAHGVNDDDNGDSRR